MKCHFNANPDQIEALELGSICKEKKAIDMSIRRN
jgi:hypothetical protein